MEIPKRKFEIDDCVYCPKILSKYIVCDHYHNTFTNEWEYKIESVLGSWIPESDLISCDEAQQRETFASEHETGYY